MEATLFWIPFIGMIVIPIVGWIFKVAITNEIESIKAQQIVDRKLFFDKFDEAKEIYVRKDIYQQATEFSQKVTDAKFESLLNRMQDQFHAVEDKIEDIKDLIIKNFNNPRNPLSVS